MRRSAFAFILTTAAIGSIGGAVRAAEPKTWEYGGGGQWPLVEAPASAKTIDNPTLDQAERMIEQDKGSDAEEFLLDWIKTNRTAPDRDRSLYLLARAYYIQGDRIKSYYQFDELLDTYPESPWFYRSLEQQYQIADDFLKGAKRKLLGMKLLSATDEAIDMLYRIQEKSPGSPLAEKAMLRTGDFYYNTGDFDLASDVYAAYLRSYPRSPEVARVRLRRAFSNYAQFRGVKHEATPLIEARAQLEDIKAKYPEMAEQENVQRFIEAINATLARKLNTTADFYRRTGHDQAAAYTYQQTIASYPQTDEAEKARQALARLPKAAVESAPKPGTSGPYDLTARPANGPSTRPSTFQPLGPARPDNTERPQPPQPGIREQ